MALWALAGRWRGGGASVAHPVRVARRPGGGGGAEIEVGYEYQVL